MTVVLDTMMPSKPHSTARSASYTDVEAPDYLNAAIQHAEKLGITRDKIDAATRRGQSRIDARRRSGSLGSNDGRSGQGRELETKPVANQVPVAPFQGPPTKAKSSATIKGAPKLKRPKPEAPSQGGAKSAPAKMGFGGKPPAGEQYDFKHLDAIKDRLAREQGRLGEATTAKEREFRAVRVSQAEKELANEIEFLKSKSITPPDEMSIDDLAAELEGFDASPTQNGLPGGSRDLPMDEGARMERRKAWQAEKGPVNDTVLYHGTATQRGEKFDSFDAGMFGSRTNLDEDKYANAGVYLTKSKVDANWYADRAESRMKPDYVDDTYPKAWTEKYYVRGRILKAPDDAVSKGEVIERALREGYDGVHLPHNLGQDPDDTFIIFDPKNIRRTDATFDPSQEQSSKLLAGMGGNSRGIADNLKQDAALAALGSVGGSFANQEDPQAGALGGMAMALGGKYALRGAPGKTGAPKGPPSLDHWGIKAYHGSPHDFDKFDSRKIGTGEGAQSYGRGLYFAENEAVAKGYRDALAKKGGDKYLVNGVAPQSRIEEEAALLFDLWKGRANRIEIELKNESRRTSKAKREAIMAFVNKWADDKSLITKQEKGRLYEVDINADPEDFLDWDKPISQQSAKVQAGVRKVLDDQYGKGTFDDFVSSNDGNNEFRNIMDNFDEITAARLSAKLRKAGVPGIKYLDQGSRGAADGTRNYVVFDDSAVNIINKAGFGGGFRPKAAGIDEPAAVRQSAGMNNGNKPGYTLGLQPDGKRIVMFHGSPDGGKLSELKLGKVHEVLGAPSISLTNDLAEADQYAIKWDSRSYPDVPPAKNPMVQQVELDPFTQVVSFDEFEELRDRDFPDDLWDNVSPEEMADWYRKNGIDAVDLTRSRLPGMENEIAVVNPEKLKVVGHEMPFDPRKDKQPQPPKVERKGPPKTR